MDSQSEENESEKVINPNNQCVLIFTCSYCGKKYNTIENISNDKCQVKSMVSDDVCPACKHNFSKCSVCLCFIKLKKIHNNELFVFCTKCHHGGHYEHYKGWFKEFNECPNSKCDCRCQEEGYKNLITNKNNMI